MTFSLETHWVWDFWLADDGDRFHLYYLHAPRSLGDERLRHRNARIGHAVSTDLHTWHDLGVVLTPGDPGAYDGTAVWTGSVVPGTDGVWRMFFTGTRFLSDDSTVNIETVGLATSTDLHTWHKQPGPIATSDERWYEVLADGTWREEAWRDPWVFADPAGDGWHMLVTARGREGAGVDRGVVAHAVSPDLETWTVQPPLSAPDAGFGHLEVLQIVTVDGHDVLIFSCDGQDLTGPRAGQRGGVWQVPVESWTGPFAIERAQLLVDERLYAGKIVRDRQGRSVLLAFENGRGDDFVGRLADPIPVRWDDALGAVVLDEGRDES